MNHLSIAISAGMVAYAFVQPAPAAQDAKYREKVVYSFCSRTNCEDGHNPEGLIDVNGMLYGTTFSGGRSGGCRADGGCGTVFSVDLSTGQEKVLYTFCSVPNCADGGNPQSGLIDVNGMLYGTTLGGGITGCGGYGCGTVFSINLRTGKEKTLYSLCRLANCADGSSPVSGLINMSGTLYGTTDLGGTNCHGEYESGCGTVFSLDPTSGTEKVLYSFCSRQNCTDGAFPSANLIAVNDVLYGTTGGGGMNGWGTVFSLDPGTGTEKVTYSFCGKTNCTDGADPLDAGLVDVNGKLYGTTMLGGTNTNYCSPVYVPCGTVFSIDPGTGAETVLYSFCSEQNCADGVAPVGGLIAVDSKLYGTTSQGGDFEGDCSATGCGTGFSVDLNTGTQTTLHSFTASPDGDGPLTGMVAVNGTLYGTTAWGGGESVGGGSVFVLKKKR